MNIRLDQLLVLKGFAASTKEALGYIGAGQVYVDDNISDKPGNLHPPDCHLEVKGLKRYVSRGGLKLEKALEYFKIDVTAKICIDIGASSGGFTDCLLQYGAEHVYSVDVAYGQFAWKLRQDQRVTVIERFNARKLTRNEIPQPVDLVVIDASFISLTKLLPPLTPLFRDKKQFLALIKPQFELPKDKVEDGGVVRDKKFHDEAIDKISCFSETQLGLKTVGVVESPIVGPKGNKEFIINLST